jgi:hypothetical protein
MILVLRHYLLLVLVFLFCAPDNTLFNLCKHSTGERISAAAENADSSRSSEEEADTKNISFEAVHLT